MGFKVVEFRKFIVSEIRCPKSSPVGSRRMDLNGQLGLKEQIRVNRMTQVKRSVTLVFPSPPPTISTINFSSHTQNTWGVGHK